jgi:hypothetical protein
VYKDEEIDNKEINSRKINPDITNKAKQRAIGPLSIKAIIAGMPIKDTKILFDTLDSRNNILSS